MKTLTQAVGRVLEAAARLDEQGVVPTYGRLRKELVGVSYNTLSTGLKAWHAQQRERQALQQAFRDHTRRLESLDKVSRIFPGSRDSGELLSELTETLLEIFQADRAFLACPLDAGAPGFRVPVEASRPEYPGAFAANSEVPLDAVSRDIFQQILDSGGPVAVDFSAMPEPSEGARRFGVQSMLATALPLMTNTRQSCRPPAMNCCR